MITTDQQIHKRKKFDPLRSGTHFLFVLVSFSLLLIGVSLVYGAVVNNSNEATKGAEHTNCLANCKYQPWCVDVCLKTKPRDQITFVLTLISFVALLNSALMAIYGAVTKWIYNNANGGTWLAAAIVIFFIFVTITRVI